MTNNSMGRQSLDDLVDIAETYNKFQVKDEKIKFIEKSRAMGDNSFDQTLE